MNLLIWNGFANLKFSLLLMYTTRITVDSIKFDIYSNFPSCPFNKISSATQLHKKPKLFSSNMNNLKIIFFTEVFFQMKYALGKEIIFNERLCMLEDRVEWPDAFGNTETKLVAEYNT